MSAAGFLNNFRKSLTFNYSDSENTQQPSQEYDIRRLQERAMSKGKAKGPLIFGLALALLLFSPGFAAAHEGHEAEDADHQFRYELELSPGDSRAFRVTWGEQPLKARWIFLLSGEMTGNAQVAAELIAPGSDEPFAAWDWVVDGQTHTKVTELPEDGYYELVFSSSGESSGPARIGFQFDQSCECTGKWLDLDGGVVVFQQKVEKDDTIQFTFAEPEGADFFVWSGMRNGAPLTWKRGFSPVAAASKSGKRITMDYVAEEAGIHYFFVESISGAGFISPEYSLQEPFGRR
jgi:hypothetical protein